ncbi:multiple sugar transport system permease protein [Gracilibacillus orientalis]|uniref:Multiple sugar transport system permease protein n=1 Tax=Gracilibacillus orientalis TaxID=334253 RepID=A0A1I4N7W7_9BACI|nr:carbohydrate ABC transporter permease [Gracilibacillus orientalis]SFM11589.1 multiple sugar transport system permease protein [Gracilibacillus orientalis]
MIDTTIDKRTKPKEISKLKKKRNRKKIISSLTFHIAALVIGVIMIYPLLWALASSFKDNATMFTNAYSLIPETWAIVENYVSGWDGISGYSFGRFMLNSLIVAGAGTIGGVFSSVMAAYALSRVNFKFSGFWFMCVMVTLMIPNEVMVVPQYIILRWLGLIDSLPALMAPWIFGHAFFIFLMVQFIRGLPISLDEAAKMDGAGKLGIFFKIILPLVAPAIVTSTIFCFYWIWQDFFQPLIFISSPEWFTVSLALNLYLDPNSYSNYGGLFAMSTLSLIPVIGVFLLFQRYLVEGIATSGVKG